MAKLGAYYGLCPLIDHRSLLGICQNKESGIVVVTLARNIAIKFKLSDQKQLCSWRTKDKFSAPIIYDEQQSRYVAAFNDSFVRTWSGDEESLDKLKKLKFNHKIKTIFVCNKKSFVVFKNGAVSSLQEALENRKQLSIESIIDTDSDYIVEVLHTCFNDYVYVGLIVQSNDGWCLHWTRFNDSNHQDKVFKVPLHMETAALRGYLLHVNGTAVNFLSLWNDGRLYSTELKEDSTNFGELFTVIESVSCKEFVSVISLDQNYIALYGCNSNEEGALLIIYNVQFKVVQTKQSFKLFTNGAKLWSIDGKLLFPVGQNLAVVPFYLDMEQLAALVGSHKCIETNIDPDISIVHQVEFVNWGKTLSSKEQVPALLEAKVADFTAQGLSKNVIFEALLEEVLEYKNVETLEEMFKYFNDIPETGLVKALQFILTLDSESFSKEKSNLLDAVLSKRFNETLLLTHLRSVLTLDEVLVLLRYIYFLWSEDGHPLPSHSYISTEVKLIEWTCILLDANYQKVLLTRDKEVGEILSFLKDHVKDELDCTEDLQLVASLLREVKNNKSLKKTMYVTTEYSVEDFPL